MSIDNIADLPPRVQYTAAVGQDEFPYTFPIFQDADLVVEVDDVVQTIVDDYTVSGATDDTGGFVTFTTPLTGGEIVTIYRDTTIERTSDFPQNGPMFSAAVNDELDRLTIVQQELKQAIRRAIRFPMAAAQSSAGLELTPISNWYERYLYINSSGELEPATVSSSPISQSIIGSLLNPLTADEAAVGITTIIGKYLPGNIRRYGAAVDGSTDDSPALRKALDLAARNGTTVTCDPPGDVKLSSTVYIPQRLAQGQRGFLISMYGSAFIGQGRGTGTILESGTGAVSTDGATNFGQGNESAQALHYGTVIEGVRFKSCDLAVRLFNFTIGCELRDCWFDDCDRALVAHRCFYMKFLNLSAAMDVVAAGEPLYDFTDVNNAMVIQGCVAASSDGSSPTGIGYRFTGGGSSIIFHGNTAESLDKGIVFNGAIQGIDIRQNYFENITTTAIDGTIAGTLEMDIDGNWFHGCTEAVDAAEWIAGKFGQSNHISGTGGTVRVADAASLATIEIAPQYFSEVEANASAASLPALYDLGESVKVVSSRRVYDAAVGFNATIVIDANASKSVPAFAYTGGNGRTGTAPSLPFCTQTLNSGSTVIDTKIVWSTVRMGILFDLQTTIAATPRQFSGIVLANSTVFRLDGLSGSFTITASDNGGFLRLTIGGAAHGGQVSTGCTGQVRHL